MADPVAAPTELLATPSSGQVVISWNAVPGATGYELFRAIYPGLPDLSADTGLITPPGFSGTTWTDDTVTNGTTYSYIVVSLSPTGSSNPSDAVTGTPSDGVTVVGTTTSVTAYPASVSAGSPVTFTATISGAPTGGTVTFYADPALTEVIGSSVSVVNGTAISSAIANLPVGTDTITAVFGGTSQYGTSDGTVAVTVVPAASTTTLTEQGPNPSLVGVGIGFTVTVSGGTAIAGETVRSRTPATATPSWVQPPSTTGQRHLLCRR